MRVLTKEKTKKKRRINVRIVKGGCDTDIFKGADSGDGDGCEQGCWGWLGRDFQVGVRGFREHEFLRLFL